MEEYWNKSRRGMEAEWNRNGREMEEWKRNGRGMEEE
jgi:hypothetical protein